MVQVEARRAIKSAARVTTTMLTMTQSPSVCGSVLYDSYVTVGMHAHSCEEVGQTVVPCSLVGKGEVGVGRTGIRHDVEPSRADAFPLETKHRHRIGALQG